MYQTPGRKNEMPTAPQEPSRMPSPKSPVEQILSTIVLLIAIGGLPLLILLDTPLPGLACGVLALLGTRLTGHSWSLNKLNAREKISFCLGLFLTLLGLAAIVMKNEWAHDDVRFLISGFATGILLLPCFLAMLLWFCKSIRRWFCKSTRYTRVGFWGIAILVSVIFIPLLRVEEYAYNEFDKDILQDSLYEASVSYNSSAWMRESDIERHRERREKRLERERDIIKVVYGTIRGTTWSLYLFLLIWASRRRLHDLGLSGYWLFYLSPGGAICILGAYLADLDEDAKQVVKRVQTLGLPWIGWIFLWPIAAPFVQLLFLIAPGEHRDNRYGKNPYGESIPQTLVQPERERIEPIKEMESETIMEEQPSPVTAEQPETATMPQSTLFTEPPDEPDDVGQEFEIDEAPSVTMQQPEPVQEKKATPMIVKKAAPVIMKKPAHLVMRKAAPVAQKRPSPIAKVPSHPRTFPCPNCGAPIPLPENLNVAVKVECPQCSSHFELEP